MPVSVTSFLKRPILSIITLGCLLSANASETFTERSSSKEFPTTITFENLGKKYTLQATGAAVRRKWFVKGYVIAHYVENPTKGDQEVVIKDIFSNDKAKQMTMVWLHRLPLQLIREGYMETIQKVLKENEISKNKADIDKFLNFFTKDAEEGDVHYIRWLPGGNFELIINENKAGSLVNPEFSRALWLLWFGPDSVVNRKSLIKRIVQN